LVTYLAAESYREAVSFITMLSKTMIGAYMVRVSVIWSKLGSVGEIIGVNLIAKLIIFIRLRTQIFI